jgi:hypothetical protein
MTRRPGAAALLAATLALVVAACPPRELAIVITPAGVDTVLEACEPSLCAGRDAAACVGVDGCAWSAETSECRRASECGTPGRPSLTPGAETSAMYILVRTSQVKVKSRSPCFSISGCEAGPNLSTCVAAVLNERNIGALADGLTFDDFEEETDGTLALAIFQSDEPKRCRAEHLVACAGLAPTFKSDDYDITCASCQGGPLASVGRDTGPCPHTPDTCFFDFCAKHLDR